MDEQQAFATSEGANITRKQSSVLSGIIGSGNTEIRKYSVLFLFCVACLGILVVASHKIAAIYLEHFPRFFDPLSYDIYNIRLYEKVRQSGRLYAAIDELVHNDRNPSRTIPLVLLCPRLLAKDFGHLYTSIPLCFSFLATLAITTYKKSRSLIFSFAGVTLFCAIPGLMNPTIGIAPNWLDMPAAMSAGAAALCILSFLEDNNLFWLAGFGILCSLTATSRWSAAFYLALYAGPVSVWSIVNYQKTKKSWLKPLAILLATAGAGIIFALWFAPKNFPYYKQFDYGLNAPIVDCFKNVALVLKVYVGAPFLIVLALIFSTNLLLTLQAKANKKQMQQLIFALLFPFAMLMFICVGVRISGEIHSVTYIIPALFVAVFATSQKLTGAKRITFQLASGLIILLAALSMYNSYNQNLAFAMFPDRVQSQQKYFEIALAKYLSENKIERFAEYDDERAQTTAEAYYHWHWLTTSLNYTSHEAYWKGFYPNLSPREIAIKVYKDNLSRVGVVCILENQTDILNDKLIDNPISMEVSSYMTEHVTTDPRWKKITTFHNTYGEVGLYRNLSLKE